MSHDQLDVPPDRFFPSLIRTFLGSERECERACTLGRFPEDDKFSFPGGLTAPRAENTAPVRIPCFRVGRVEHVTRRSHDISDDHIERRNTAHCSQSLIVRAWTPSVQPDAKHSRGFLAAKNPPRFCCVGCPFGGHLKSSGAQGSKLSFAARQNSSDSAPLDCLQIIPGHPLRGCGCQFRGVA